MNSQTSDFQYDAPTGVYELNVFGNRLLVTSEEAVLWIADNRGWNGWITQEDEDGLWIMIAEQVTHRLCFPISDMYRDLLLKGVVRHARQNRKMPQGVDERVNGV